MWQVIEMLGRDLITAFLCRAHLHLNNNWNKVTYNIVYLLNMIVLLLLEGQYHCYLAQQQLKHKLVVYTVVSLMITAVKSSRRLLCTGSFWIEMSEWVAHKKKRTNVQSKNKLFKLTASVPWHKISCVMLMDKETAN